MSNNSSINPINLASPQFMVNPYPFYARLRNEAPVYRMTANRPATSPVWLITRYQDVSATLKDERFVKDPNHALPPGQVPKKSWAPDILKIMDNNMLDKDVPDHTHLRGLVHKVFTPGRIEQMRARVQQLADELLDTAAKNKHFDLIEDYALPIPMTIISEILGVPVEDRAKFRGWTKIITSAFSQPTQLLWSIPPFIGLVTYIRKDRKSTRLNSSHIQKSRMPSSA